MAFREPGPSLARITGIGGPTIRESPEVQHAARIDRVSALDKADWNNNDDRPSRRMRRSIAGYGRSSGACASGKARRRADTTMTHVSHT